MWRLPFYSPPTPARGTSKNSYHAMWRNHTHFILKENNEIIIITRRKMTLQKQIRIKSNLLWQQTELQWCQVFFHTHVSVLLSTTLLGSEFQIFNTRLKKKCLTSFDEKLCPFNSVVLQVPVPLHIYPIQIQYKVMTR